MFPKRTSKGCHQSDQRWNCFRGSTGKTERQGGAHIVDFLECIDTRLNWSEPNWTYKCCGSLSSRQLHTNFRGWMYSSPLSFRQLHTNFRGWIYSSPLSFRQLHTKFRGWINSGSLHWNEHWSTFAWIVTWSHIIADFFFSDCDYEGVSYTHGTDFTPSYNPCLNCTCDNSIVRCRPVYCPPVNFACSRPMAPPGQCCPSMCPSESCMKRSDNVKSNW